MLRAALGFLQTQLLLQIVDVGATVLEVFVVHDLLLQLNVGFDAVDDQFSQAFFMRAIATSRFSPKVISLPIMES